VTRDQDYRAEGCILVHSIDEALSVAGDVPELMVVGGALLYGQMLSLAGRMYLTLVHAGMEGDTYFPEFDPSEWQEVARESHPPDEKNAYGYTFVTLERR